MSVNRSKKSLAVNLKNERGKAICRRLATEWADVVVENFKVGTMDGLGLGYDELRRSNPGLIYCSITGFGTTGPFKDRPGYDVVASGMYGLMSITGDRRPSKVGVAITDVLTGSLANNGILAALHERERTGKGQRIDTSLMETQLASLVNIASSSLNALPGTPPPKRWGTAHESIVPYQTFPCKHVDGKEEQFIVVGAGNDAQFQLFCKVLDMNELARDERFATNAGRVAHRDVLIPILESKFMERTRDEWVQLLEGKGFSLGPVRTVPEAFACEQAANRDMLMELDHPVAGNVILPGHPIKYSAGPQGEEGHAVTAPSTGDDILHPPMLGEHTEEILRDVLGVEEDELQRLVEEKTVECWRRHAYE